ncbi:MAG: hemerythrin domain-containing protein, partial [Actinobacteria bacterium]|nr:hemerythrin domain-containing protein [Actinomycetota bacterium]
HQQLRDELTRIRAELGRDDRDESDAPVQTELQSHCLAFCAALSTHHTDEDDDIFPALREAQPELAPAIDKLRDDHIAIAAILVQIRTLVTRAQTARAAALPGLRRELDGLAAIAESHFRYEERVVAGTVS